ncbi:MAG TPA: hypothetical protein VMA53_13115 [Stellaceae bacterium]|nr:hypothetical protein [Stellaceae bacterium]
MARARVLIVGLEPSLIDFSDPAYAPGRNAAAVRAGLETDEAHLNALGYDAELCLIDFGETAEMVLRHRLGQKSFDCILIGAGVRLAPQNTLLLEKLVNIAHTDAPQAKLCFNTKPTDTAEAVQRWVPPSGQA